MPKAIINKISTKLDYKAISTAIIEKFGSHKECAVALGISEQNLSHKLKRLSNKFIHQLKFIGVKIPDQDYGFTLDVKSKYVNEDPQHYKDCIAEITSLKSELIESKKLQTILINRLTEIEKDNEKLRSECAAQLKTIANLGGNKIGNKL